MRKPKHYIKELKRFVKNSKKAFDIINKDQISDISKDVRRLDTSIKGLDKTTKQTTKEIAEDIQELQNLTHEIPVESITQLIGNINSFKTRFFHDNKDLLNRIPNSDKLITSCITNGIEFLYYSSEEDKMYFETKEGTVLATDLYYGIVLQMFAEKTYTIPPHFRNTEYVAFDFGMNRGYSTLWFAQDSNCKKVYGFEIDRDTYKYALDNFNLNPHLRDKIEGFDYGLSNTNEDIDLTYIPGQDSVSTISKDFEDNYYSTQRKMIVQKKKANVRKSSFIPIVIYNTSCKALFSNL